MKKLNLTVLFFLFLTVLSYGQPSEQLIKVIVAPDHTNWEYKLGEPVTFSISVLQNGNLLKNAVIQYELGPEKLVPVKKDSLMAASGIFAPCTGAAPR